MDSNIAGPYAIKPEDKLAYAKKRREAHISIALANAELTGGVLGLTERYTQPGFDTGYHINHNEDEGFFVLNGTMTFFAEGVKVEAKSGTWVFAPRGRPHQYVVTGNSPAHYLIFNFPAGFESMAQEGDPAGSLTLGLRKPANSIASSEEARAKMIDLYRKFNVEALDHFTRMVNGRHGRTNRNFNYPRHSVLDTESMWVVDWIPLARE